MVSQAGLSPSQLSLLRLSIGQLLGKEKVIVTQWGRVCWFSLAGYLLQTVLFSALNIDIIIRYPLLTVTRRDDNRKDLRTLTCGLPGGLPISQLLAKGR